MAELFDCVAAAPVLRTFVQNLIAFCSRPQVCDVMSGRFVGLTVPEQFVKFLDPPLNNSGEIRPKAAGCSISAIVFKLQ